MVLEHPSTASTVNARRTDAFDVFNCKFYSGPNSYLETGAFVFDFTLTGQSEPLPIEEYAEQVGDRYPQIRGQSFESYAQLFAQTASIVGQLDMNLHLHRWSTQVREGKCRIAVEALHARTSRVVVYGVWDWFEAMTRNRPFDLDAQIEVWQTVFRQSVYGGPTVYALLRTAHQMGIPAFYLWDEGLMQYGFGRKQVRGVATTFDSDSHLDSDFTTRKDDCKAFLSTLGFPVPQGEIVVSLEEAIAAADRVGYPVAVKPVVGHKGEGVTAGVRDEEELELAYDLAVQAIAPDDPVEIIVERFVAGKDYRVLCVNGRFVAATERRSASVTGDGQSTIAELIDQENRRPDRSDTPTSPMSKIKIDESMHQCLREQGLSMESVLEGDRTVFLRKVANLSSGGMSLDATANVHPDNIILAQDIAQHFRLTCLGIDLIARDLSRSWKDGDFGILEINAAPGIYMHLKPTVGDSIDVPSHILHTFFESNADARIPIVTFNRVSVSELQDIIDHILLQHPTWTIGAVCRDGVFINRSEKIQHRDYNVNVQNLLRNPRLDLLIAEYSDSVLERDGMFYFGSDLLVLNNPTETERVLTRDVFEHSTVVVREGDTISIRRHGLIEQYHLGASEPFQRVYLKELATVL